MIIVDDIKVETESQEERARLLEHSRLWTERYAQRLVERAERLGLVLTIEQRPLQPLAMGNYESVVSVRPARSKA